jgi:hypothetical protein
LRRLLVSATQERYYAKIVEKYMSFCTEAGDSTSLLKRFSSLQLTPQENATPSPVTPVTVPAPGSTELSHILGALRKLREGIVASKRADAFASQVYLFAIRLGALCKSPETYHPAILHLLRVIHPRHSLTSLELQEVVDYLVLDAACRRGDLAEAYSLRNRYHGVRDAKVDAVLRALVQDNWVLFFRAKDSLDGHKARIVDFASQGLRKHLLKAFGRSYLSVPLQFLESSTGLTWGELESEYAVGWELNETRVVIRKIQGRS